LLIIILGYTACLFLILYIMKVKYVIVPCALLLVACSPVTQNPPQETDTTPPVTLSWDVSDTGSQVNTGSIQTPVNINSVSVWANETKDVTLELSDGKWVLNIDYGTWARVKVHFTSEGTKNLKISLQTPWDVNWNIRVSQIVFPDGTSDGPFWKDLNYKLTKNGEHQVILSANMMAGDRWSWNIIMNLELQ
jgi:hypothetical protein